jgi:hypothetical protein
VGNERKYPSSRVIAPLLNLVSVPLHGCNGVSRHHVEWALANGLTLGS